MAVYLSVPHLRTLIPVRLDHLMKDHGEEVGEEDLTDLALFRRESTRETLEVLLGIHVEALFQIGIQDRPTVRVLQEHVTER